ncbi:MAG: hypothetical protein ACE145_19215 [Terriglobia bacterium]
MNPVIPAPVPVPLPAPAWLVQLLLVFTSILHFILMNLLVGGTLILTVSSYLGRRDLQHRDLARRAARVMPPIVAFTITLGVAPLLFLQLLYGQLFYTSSVLMAWSWLAVVLLLVLGYYGIYWFNMQQEELGPRAFWVMLLTSLFFLHIMKIFTQNMSLLERPQIFFEKFLAGPVGNYLGLADLLTFARLSHFLVASLAVAGLGLAVIAGQWSHEAPELSAWSRRYGIRWFMAGTGVQLLTGLWFLFSQPHEIRSSFLGGDRLSTAILVAAVILAVLGMLAARRSLAACTVAIVGTISLMTVVRHIARIARLQPYFDPHTLPVEGQWIVFSIFVVVLLAGIGTLGWMLYQFFRLQPTRVRPS